MAERPQATISIGEVAQKHPAIAAFHQGLETALPSAAVIPPDLLAAFVSLLMEQAIAWLMRCLPQEGPEGVKEAIAGRSLFARAAVRNAVLQSAEELNLRLGGRDVNRIRELMLNRGASLAGFAAIDEAAESLDWMIFRA